MKVVLIGLIKIYQKTLSLDTGILAKFSGHRHCRFVPSCSQYAIDSINELGVVRGIWNGTKRVARCHPWHEGGFDPVKK